MNVTVFIAGIVALLAAIGHFTIGKKQFLGPMLNADFELVAKKVMHSVFHYVSVFLLLSAFFLIMIGSRGTRCVFDPSLILLFLGASYFLMALWQILIALTAKVSLLKMFQWIFWLVIAVLIFLGMDGLPPG